MKLFPFFEKYHSYFLILLLKIFKSNSFSLFAAQIQIEKYIKNKCSRKDYSLYSLPAKYV